MSNVTSLHAPRQGRGNDPKAIFVAKVITSGKPRELEALRKRLWTLRHDERDGRYAVVGHQLLHLAGWSTCRMTANTMNLSLDNETDPADGDVVQLTAWPFDVSGCPSVALSDAPSDWHLPVDRLEECFNDAG